ncbi:MAG: alpha/beta hydrolase, partial [Pseudomonadota bacterium]
AVLMARHTAPKISETTARAIMIRVIFRILLAIPLLVLLAGVGFWFAATARETSTANELLLPESRIFETVHGNLHALEAGPEDGVPVLLIHGSVGWAGLWSATTAFLSDQGYRVVALDLPPMGLSDRTSGMDYSRQAQALRILAVAEALDTPPLLVAHSFGAGAAVEALIASSSSFAGGVVIAGALNLGDDGAGMEMPLPLRSSVVRKGALASTVTNTLITKPLFRQFVHRKDSVTREIVDQLEYPFNRVGTTGALAEWLPTLLIPPRSAASTDPTRYPEIAVPVALIWGREDTVTPPEQGEAIGKALGGTPIFWMDNVGHIPQIEATDAFHQVLRAALDRIEQG